MSIENEIRLLTQAMQQQTEAIQGLIDLNQKMLEVLIDVVVTDDGSGQPMMDMDGNPV